MKLVNSDPPIIVILAAHLSPAGYHFVVVSPCVYCNEDVSVYVARTVHKKISFRCPHCDWGLYFPPIEVPSSAAYRLWGLMKLINSNLPVVVALIKEIFPMPTGYHYEIIGVCVPCKNDVYYYLTKSFSKSIAIHCPHCDVESIICFRWSP